MPQTLAALKIILRDFSLFTKHAAGIEMRAYQRAAAQAIIDSVLHKRGDTIVVIFPRQSGKNELQAHVETYLMTLFSQLEGEIVKASPTWRPQSLNAMRRLERALKKNVLTTDAWRRREGYHYEFGNAHIYFMSAEPHANAVGHTASLLLECDEAQDVQPAVWDKNFLPMAASTNATRAYFGTAWTSQTLLARELRAARAAEAIDGRPRAFVYTALDVGADVPAYAAFVADQVQRLGRNHPIVRTQYFCEEIDAQGGLFPPERRALLLGTHAAESAPQPGAQYAVLIDVAGADETNTADPTADQDKRDATALTVVKIDTGTLSDPGVHLPTYRIVHRQGWVNVRHATLYPVLRAICEHWQARYVVIDATGIGAGIASFLLAQLGEQRVLPFIFTAASKSEAGYAFIAVIETGRLKDHADDGNPDRAAFWRQLDYIGYQAKPNQMLHWGAPLARDASSGEMMHDDWILSACLCHVLDDQPWGEAHSAVIPPRDILARRRP